MSDTRVYEQESMSLKYEPASEPLQVLEYMRRIGFADATAKLDLCDMGLKAIPASVLPSLELSDTQVYEP